MGKEFKYEIGQVFKDNKRNLTIIDREYRKDRKGWSHKYYKYHCNKCGAELWMIEYSLLKGNNCACCSNQIVVKGINDIATTNPELVKYFVNIEDTYTHTCCSGNKILMKCLDCGFEKTQSPYVLFKNGIGCNKCGDGIRYPNKLMLNLLQYINVEFETEKRFNWCKYFNTYKNKEVVGIYDFYIPSMNLIIEMDGGFHNKINSMSGQTAEESKYIDNLKDKLAEYHGLKVIRIDCDYGNKDRFDYIKNNIINSKIFTIFNLNSIDWVLLNNNCECSLVKMACSYKNKNSSLSTVDIGKIMGGYCKGTISKWLKIGNKLNWCKYDVKKEKSRGYNINGKAIILLKDELQKVFMSCHDLDRVSENIFGVHLGYKSISRVCRNERNRYKGYKFKYIEDLTEEEYIKYDIENKLKEINNNKIS